MLDNGWPAQGIAASKAQAGRVLSQGRSFPIAGDTLARLYCGVYITPAESAERVSANRELAQAGLGFAGITYHKEKKSEFENFDPDTVGVANNHD